MPRAAANGRFLELQRAHFATADPAHFAWQTGCPHVADEERRLVEAAVARMTPPLLEVGCGEGANLAHLPAALRKAPGNVAIDLCLPKLAFARSAHPRVGFAAADGMRLPFRDGAFTSVLVRDTLHHVPDPVELLRECCRCLAAGGRLAIVEPNGRNPVILAQALSTTAERLVLHRPARRIAREIAGLPLVLEEASFHQPLPLSRALFHHRFGLPSLAAHAGSRALVVAVERAARVLPHGLWAYMVFRCRRA